jgi:hypothetical protein
MSTEVIGALTDEELGLSPKMSYIERNIKFRIEKTVYELEVLNDGFDEVSQRGKNAKLTIFVPSTVFFFPMKRLWWTRIRVEPNRIGEYEYLKLLALTELDNFKTLKMQEILNN